MSKTKQKVQMPAGIRNKLMAAMSMLLVSSILLVSSTYAWFTLSTAPEVSGITTSVGANGNLEIALLTTSTAADTNTITSNVGDSSAAQGATKANVTWGNLIDLSDSGYGLSSVKLLPAELNEENGKVLTSILKTAVYGTDGRVASLAANTVSATWGTSTFTKNGETQDYGVRAIGSTTQMNDRQLGLINARSAISSNSTAANAVAANALNTYGSVIGNIAVTHGQATETDPDTYTQDQMNALKAFADELDTALDDVELAIRYAIVAYATKLDSDELYNTAYSAVFAKTGNAYTNELATLVENYDGASTALSAMIDKLDAAKESVATAKAAYKTAYTTCAEEPTDLTGHTHSYYVWNDVKAVMEPLLDTSLMTINGVAVSDAKAQSSEILSVFNQTHNFVLDMPSGSGVCATIADFVGSYSGNVTISIPVLGETTATMTASTKQNPTYLTAAHTAATAITAGSTASTATINLSDTYGYVLDFAFRTNASNSSLQLQTAGAQRVYSDSTATNTQGSGSYMEFDGSTSGLNTTAMVNLMSAIRVVFVDDQSNILGRAKLDLGTGNYTVTGTTVKANLYMYTISTSTTGEGDNKQTVTTETLSADKSEICDLIQNTVKKVSVIVYLDGNLVDNTMVANASASMTGSLNLQFSSSATLVPMENTSMREGSASEAATTTAAATTTETTTAAAESSSSSGE